MKSHLIIILFFLSSFSSIGKESDANLAFKQHSAFVFVENNGQVKDQYNKKRNDIDFKLTQENCTIFIGSAALHYQWVKAQSGENKATTNQFDGYRLDVELLGANKHPAVMFKNPDPYYENYYLANAVNGITAHAYSEIIYKDIYPNIDWQISIASGTDGKANLKYNFILHPGSNYKDIKIQYNGASSTQLIDHDLKVETPFASVTENAPYTFESISKHSVACEFDLLNNVLSFELPTLKSTEIDKDIIIDPFINWATYYGGSGLENFNVSTADGNGQPYLAGGSYSMANIATTGAYQTALLGNADGYVVKFNTAGQRQWATYFGGGDIDFFSGIACDGSTSVYLGGRTNSIGIASSGAHQTSLGANFDGLLVKLNSAGQLQWATYYGGSDTDMINGVACDLAGNILITGKTKSANNIATTGSISGDYDGFLAKFNSAGVRIWAKYIGGGGADDMYAVCADAAANVYVGGEAKSTGLAFGTVQQSIYGGGATDGVLAKYNASGTLQWASYYGGESDDKITCLAMSNTTLYIGGITTTSTLNIATSGAYNTSGSYGSGFFSSFSNAGMRNWGSYLSGGAINGIAADAFGNLYLTGATGGIGASPNIYTSDAYKIPVTNQQDEAFIMKFNAAGARLYGTYFGGDLLDYGQSITATNSGKLIISGFTFSNSGLATANGFQTSRGGGMGVVDAYLALFTMDTIAFFPTSFADTLFCAGDSVHIAYKVSTKFRSANSFQLQLSDASGNFTAPVAIASLSSDTDGILNGVIPINTAGGTGYRFRIAGTAPATISARDTLNIHIKPVAAAFSASSNTPVCANDTLKLYGTTSSTGVTWSWSGPLSFNSSSKDTIIANAQTNRSGDYILTATYNGCVVRDTETVLVKPLPSKPNAGSNTPLCAGSTLNLTASSLTSGVTWSWTGPGSYTSSQQNPSRTGITTSDAGNYVVSAILNGCSSKDTEAVTIYPIPPAPSASNNGPLCTGSTLNLMATPVTGASSYSWTGPAAFTAVTQNSSRSNVQLSHAGVYSVTASVNGCTSLPGVTTVAISTGPSVSIYANPNDTVCAGSNVTFVALPINGGTSPQYKWYRGSNFTGITTVAYPVSAPANGETFYCELTNNTTCSIPASANSNNIILTVQPPIVPSVTVVANPATPVPPNLLITFTANAVNGGASPQFQWTRNGQKITGATGNSWSATNLSNHDTICVVLTSSEMCAQPQSVKSSNCVAVEILTGVEGLSNSKNLVLYPNPNNGTFTLSAYNLHSQDAVIEILNEIGQVIWNRNTAVHNGNLYERIDLKILPPGIYVLKVRHSSGIETIKFTVSGD